MPAAGRSRSTPDPDPRGCVTSPTTVPEECGMVAPPASRVSDEEISVAAACSVLERLEPGRLDERALDDVWADPELLAIEFEAIVSANYPTSADRPDRRPPLERCPVTTSRTPIPHQVDRQSRTPAPARRRPARRLAVARERGPPATT